MTWGPDLAHSVLSGVFKVHASFKLFELEDCLEKSLNINLLGKVLENN